MRESRLPLCLRAVEHPGSCREARPRGCARGPSRPPPASTSSQAEDARSLRSMYDWYVYDAVRGDAVLARIFSIGQGCRMDSDGWEWD